MEVYDLGNDERLVVPQLTMKTNIVERGIIRVEDGKNVEIVMNNGVSESVNKAPTKSSNLNLDEFFEKFNKKNKNISENDFNSLLDDVQDLGFVYHIGTDELIISYKLNSNQSKIPIFRTSCSTTSSQSWFVPIDITSRLEKFGYSASIGLVMLDKLKIYLSKKQKYVPYEKPGGFYYIDTKTLVDKKDDIISILEDFASNF